jgi:hypothetical protein
MMSAPTSIADRAIPDFAVSIDCAHGWNDASQLVVRRSRRGPGPRWLTAEVDNVHTLIDHLGDARNRRIGCKRTAPARDAVGGKVENPHNDGTVENYFTCTGLPTPNCKWLHAGAGSGPPNSGGFTGLGDGTELSFAGSAGGDGGLERGGRTSPRASLCTSSPVSVSRSSRAAATR